MLPVTTHAISRKSCTLHIQSLAMKLPPWDRLYFFAFSSVIFAVLAFLVILLVPLIEVSNTETGVSQLTLLADGQTLAVLLSLLPLALAANTLFVLPKNGLPDKGQKINIWLPLFSFTFGLLLPFFRSEFCTCPQQF
jgi:hypothetical protein